jgi:hypothetical protein
MTRSTWLLFAIYLLFYAAAFVVDRFSGAVGRFVDKLVDVFYPRSE